ncbi:hypothetical protein KC318_g7253 [Hortaea werneckii]|uniref:DUF4078 domain-containing protein n=1 Tax=Hortaea werneckii TaxID=91943 RepID=A0A3M6YSU5_HORWE|nr:hypothetical protein KC334_g6197 [Hortaea werneckii]KAI7004306.1 hypothetical protein KC355_g8775 [Hortaea werneckii]KAI7665214.1 hypothetical protein KC318_g7253 [Hortaea werneckii]RMY06088.1 hypothetical protein D0867_09813 [Hortaea werneckii]RMY28831.1 hypothetical protein D0866_09131 [Hortaea werneckii]
MSSKDASLYGEQKPRKLAGGKEISSSTTLSFTSQLSSLINNADAKSNPKPTASRSKPKKEDIFSTHNRNTAKRAKRDLEDTPAFEQKHSTKSDALDSNTWERSKRKMEEKARLYAAMKRGDVEDVDEKYAVDFDKKWTDRRPDEEDSEQDDEDDDDMKDQEEEEEVEYIDEFGRTRKGPRTAALRAETTKLHQASAHANLDRFVARPSAPASLIRGDTIQHQAFSPDLPHLTQMETLASKRDKPPTPPPETHFDSAQEIRTKGTGFFQFSGEAEERGRQMEGLARERAETERVRREKGEVGRERQRRIEERRREIAVRRGKRKAEDFLERLGSELEGRGDGDGGGGVLDGQRHGGDGEDGSGSGSGSTEMMDRIQDAVRREEEDDKV